MKAILLLATFLTMMSCQSKSTCECITVLHDTVYVDRSQHGDTLLANPFAQVDDWEDMFRYPPRPTVEQVDSLITLMEQASDYVCSPSMAKFVITHINDALTLKDSLLMEQLSADLTPHQQQMLLRERHIWLQFADSFFTSCLTSRGACHELVEPNDPWKNIDAIPIYGTLLRAHSHIYLDLMEEL